MSLWYTARSAVSSLQCINSIIPVAFEDLEIDMTKQPEDVQQRQQALLPDQSFICEAPAGVVKPNY